MILVNEYARVLKEFLDGKIQKDDDVENAEKFVKKYKIHVRIGFQLDVFVFVSNMAYAKNLEQNFYDYLESNEFSHSKYFNAELKKRENVELVFFSYPESELDDPYYQNVDNSIDFGPRLRFDSFLDNTKKEINQDFEQNVPEMNEPTVVTFYSYKGGMGRTTAMMAYAMYVADVKGKNVVVIDCDLEAPGYLNFFGLDKNPELQSSGKNGFVEFFCDALFTNDLDIHNYVVDVDGWQNDEQQEIIDSGKKQGKIWVVPAGNLNETARGSKMSSVHRSAYLEGLAKLNLSDSQTVVGIFKLLFEKLNELNESAKPDVILIDSRTGFNDIFGNAVMNLSKSVVGFFGRSRQTAPGYMNLLQMHVNSGGKFNLHLAYSILPDGINEATSDMQAYMANLYADHDVSMPDETPIHRVPALELIGTGDQERDRTFRERIGSIGKKKNRNIDEKQGDDYKNFSDYVRLFEAIDSDVSENVLTSTSLEVSARNIVLECLQEALDKISFSAEETRGNEPFVLRECMAKIFDKDACLFYGVDGSGRTTLFQALENPSRSKKITKVFSSFLKSSDKNIVNYHFVNVKVSSEKLDSMLDNLYGGRELKNPEERYNFWQMCIWKILLANDGDESLNRIRNTVLESSDIRRLIGEFENESKHPVMERFNAKIARSIEMDLFRLERKLKEDGSCVIISFDIDDNLEYSKNHKKVVSGLIEYWRLNRNAFDFIWPKIFAGMNRKTEFEKTSCVSMNWHVEELFFFLYELMIDSDDKKGETVVRDALEHLLKKDDEDFDRIASICFERRRNPIVSLNGEIKYLSYVSDELEKLFFGDIVLVGGKKLGRPKNYFEKIFSSGSNVYVLLRPFIMMLKYAVSKSMRIRDNDGSRAIIPSEVFASKNAEKDIAAEYYKYLEHKIFNGKLAFLKMIVEGRGRMLEDKEFKKLLPESGRLGDGKKIYVWEPNLVQAGIIDCMKWGPKQNAAGQRQRKTYYFAPIFWDLWNLREAGNDI